MPWYNINFVFVLGVAVRLWIYVGRGKGLAMEVAVSYVFQLRHTNILHVYNKKWPLGLMRSTVRSIQDKMSPH